MPIYLVSQPGTVAAIPIPNDVATPLAITGWDGALSFKAILTGMAVRMREGFQVQNSLDDRVYVSLFGSRMGELRLSGITFNADCSGNARTGVESVLDYYNTYRASSRGSPIVAMLGTSPAGVFSGFLVGCDVDLGQAETRMGQFALQAIVLPRRSGS